MTIETAERPAPFLRRKSGTPEAIRVLWRIYDVALLTIVLLAATEGMGRLSLQTPLWMLAYGMTVGRIVLQPSRFAGMLRANTAFMVYPLVCATSVIWSALPEQSLVSAFQMTMTIMIGLVLGWRFEIKQICIATFLVTAFTIGLSLINWQTGLFGKIYADSGGLLGIFPQKNLLGKACLVCVLSAIALMFIPVRPRAIKILVLLTGLLMSLLALRLSGSTTPLLLLPVLAGLLLLLNYRELGPRVRAFGLIGVLVIGSTVPLLMEMARFDPVAATLHATQKNATLTGRTELWTIAEMVIERYWLLGVGFNAFWDSPRFASLAILGQSIGGETIRAFHNVVLEVWVGTGIAGVAAILIYMATPMWRGLRLWWASGGIAPAYALTICTTLLINAMINPSLYRQHELAVVMLAMFGAAVAKALVTSRPTARPRPQGPSFG